MDGVSFQEILENRWVPPSPTPLKSRDWRGVCKKCLQNLEPQGFRGQNLDYKGLGTLFGRVECTASALTMICSFGARGKVRCHIVLWKSRMDGKTEWPQAATKRLIAMRSWYPSVENRDGWGSPFTCVRTKSGGGPASYSFIPFYFYVLSLEYPQALSSSV